MDSPAPFYGRWKADEGVPALFLNTTNVTLGVPHLISELDLRASSRYSELATFVESPEEKRAIQTRPSWPRCKSASAFRSFPL